MHVPKCFLLVATLATISLGSIPKAQAEELRPDEMADLSILALRADRTYPHPGELVRIELVVRNNATHEQRNVPVVLYAGRARASATKLNISAGETKLIPLRIPAELGMTTVSARIDPDARLPTINRLDDVATIKIAATKRTQSGADLAVDPISIEVDASTGARTALIPVRNIGSAAAAAPVEIKVDGLPAHLEVVRLPPGKGTELHMVLPEEATALSASVNPRDKELEQSATNNDVERDLREPIDIRVDRFSATVMATQPGEPRKAMISFRITNRGATDIRPPLPVLISSAAEAERSGRGQEIKLGGLAPGQSLFVNRIIEIPAGATEVRVEPDPEHNVLGSNRGLGVFVWPFGPTPQVGQWISIGPTLINNGGLGAIGRLSAIAMNRADPATIYVGAAASGVWKSADGGISWQPIADGLPTLAIAALAITPTQPSRVYVATADAGVFRSDDAGASWQSLPGSPDGEVRWGVMIVSPRDPAVVYLNAADGVYRSSDSGGTWTRVLVSAQVTDLIMAQGTPTTLFAAVAGDGVYKTNDGGNTWARLAGLPRPSPGFQITLACPRNVPATLYAALSMPGGLQLFRTDDGGATWIQKSTPADTQLYNDNIGADAVDPNIVYVTGVRIWRSTDGGNTFSVLSGPHVDHHAFYNDPVSDTTIYALSDGGIFKSVNRGQSWSFIGAGIANVEFYDHGLAASDPKLTFGGTQDNGTLKGSGSSAWTEILGGDGATVAIDPTDPNIIYAMNQGADSVQRTANGSSFQGFANGLPTGAVCNNLLFILHPKTRTTLIAPCLALWRTTTTTPPGNWQQILAQPATGTIVRAAVDRTTDLYFAGTSDGRILAGPSGGSWREVFAHPIATAGVTDIDVDPADPRRLFVAFRASGADRIYRLTRSTSAPSSMIAEAIGNGLPSGLTVQSLAIDPALNFTAYAATNKGVYRGRAISSTGTWFWSLYSNGMPLADARDLEVHPTTGVLRLATYGRSAYEMNTAPPFGSVLNAQGRITMLRAHDVGTGFGPPNDFLDVEAVLWLDSMPGNSFGFQLRSDANTAARRGMFSLLRKAFAANRAVSIDYIRTGLRSGRIIRVMLIP